MVVSRLRVLRLLAVVLLFSVTVLGFRAITPVASAQNAHARDVAFTAPSGRVFVHVAPAQASDVASPVLVLLHGMGGTGDAIASPWLDEADARGWVVVAPTFEYGDWFDPAAVRADDLRFTTELHETLAGLSDRVGRPVSTRAMLFGFSRGAQLAHRYALYYPTDVEAVAALSAGTYTLPDAEMMVAGRMTRLPLPFGIADLDRWIGHACNQRALTRVPFWIGVGANDNRSADVPRPWDPYLGSDRLNRARAFVRALERHSVAVKLHTFPGTDHEFTYTIRDNALRFFDGIVLAHGGNGATALAAGLAPGSQMVAVP